MKIPTENYADKLQTFQYFNSIRQKNGRYGLTHNFENIVYNELIFIGYEVFAFNKYGHEIDFLAQKDGKEYLIQAAYSIAEEKNYQREFALFYTLDQSRRKIIVTTDEFDYSTSTVKHISLARFLEFNSLED